MYSARKSKPTQPGQPYQLKQNSHATSTFQARDIDYARQHDHATGQFNRDCPQAFRTFHIAYSTFPSRTPIIASRRLTIPLSVHRNTHPALFYPKCTLPCRNYNPLQYPTPKTPYHTAPHLIPGPTNPPYPTLPSGVPQLMPSRQRTGQRRGWWRAISYSEQVAKTPTLLQPTLPYNTRRQIYPSIPDQTTPSIPRGTYRPNRI
jgi:hypothetical protein